MPIGPCQYTLPLKAALGNPCAFARMCSNILYRKSSILNFEKVFEEVRLVPMELLQKIITTRLTASKTMFVSPAPVADADWAHFRRAMRSDKRIKFSRNPDRRSGSLEAYASSYGFTRGLHQRIKDGVPRRLKAIVSNGLLGLWRSWKNWRLQFSQRGNSHDEVQWLPLSSWGSDLYHVFRWCGLCSLCTLVVFAVEIGANCCSQYFVEWIVWAVTQAIK